MRGSPEETVLFVDLDDPEALELLLPRGGRRASRRERALTAHSRRKKVFKIADTRRFNLSNKNRGRAPDREFRPLKEKATKLARRA